jgi:TonB-dependent SusC/RagA subfamily outer membrane receptor
MRYKILLPLCLFSFLFAIAQQKPDKAFAIVGAGNNYNWMNVLEIDLSTGEVTRKIYEKEKTSFQLFDSKTRKELNDKTKLREHRSIASAKTDEDKASLQQGTQPALKEVVVVNGNGSRQNAWKSVAPGAATNTGQQQPLILVDGIERGMNDVSVNEVATVSVLKDASATAAFGVKGANGVILITTKSAQTGKPEVNTGGAIGKTPAPGSTVVASANGRVVKSGVTVIRVDGRDVNSRLASRAYESPTATMVAAAAYDQRHNKLFFTPMHVGELRWIDLYDKSSSLKVFCVTDQPLTPTEKQNETTQITRMVIAADGNGYALSNDGNYFIRFTTGKQPAVTQLGALKDDGGNNDHSIHSRSMYGGDMIADAFGDLYLITASANVFKIDINTREAKHLGAIQGLPKRYTTNGAAINNNGDLIVCSATATDGHYKVDLDNLQAEKVDVKYQLNSSDLASGNLAFERRKKELSNASLKAIDLTMSNNKVTVFPNPVIRDNFRVNFKQSEAGQYDVQLVDLSGKIVFQKRVNVGIVNQTETIVVDNGLAKGVYMLKIVDRSKRLISSGNLVLQ